MKTLDSYKTTQDEVIELSIDENNTIYVVDCWDKNGNNRWYKAFNTLEKAKIELERFRHCEVKK